MGYDAPGFNFKKAFLSLWLVFENPAHLQQFPSALLPLEDFFNGIYVIELKSGLISGRHCL